MANNTPNPNKDAESDDKSTTDTFSLPIIHGSSIEFHHDDLAVYNNTMDLWRQEVGEPGERAIVARYTPEFADEEYHFFLRSSRWKAGTGEGDDYSAYFKYHISAQIKADDGNYKNPVQSLSLLIYPQRHGMTYKDGNTVELPHGEGSHIVINTTYADSSGEVLRRGQRLLEEILDEYDPSSIQWDTGSISKLETHLRFDRRLMETAVTGLINTERLISWMGRSTITGAEQRRREPGWDIWKFGSGAWHRLGFQKLGDYIYGLKAYSANRWEKHPENHFLHHPKIEAFYFGKKSDESQPHVDDWDELVDALRHITTMHAHNWIGIDRDDLVPDDFFDGPAAPPYEYECLEGRRDDLHSMQQDTKTAIMKEAMRSRSDVPYALLAAMIDHPHGVPFKTLREQLNASQRTIRRHAKRMEDAGIAERVGNPGELRFKSAVIHETARETMEEMNPGETAADQRERRESDDSDDTNNQRRQWNYLSDTPMTSSELTQHLLDGNLSEGDVRVAIDALAEHAPSDAPADDD